MERRKFSKEFKLEAVQLSYDSDRTVSQVAANLGIRAELLYRWRSEVRRSADEAFPGNGQLKPQDAEATRLGRELEQVRLERDILKHIIGRDWQRSDRGDMISLSPAGTSDFKMGAAHPLLLTDGACCDF